MNDDYNPAVGAYGDDANDKTAGNSCAGGQ